MNKERTYLCRCECVTVNEVAGAIAEGNLTINDIKRRSRAGMGICQGIYCVNQIAQMLIEHGVEPSTIEPVTARPPARLIPLAIAADD